MCRFIWEWIYEPQYTRGISGGFKGSQIQKSGRLSNGWTDWHHIWKTYVDSSGNGHRLSTIRPSTLGGGVRGSQIQRSGVDVKRLIRLTPNLVHMCRFIWEWIYAKQIAPRHKGALGGFRGSNIQKSREAVKRLDQLAPTLVHVGGFIWEYKYKSPLNTPGGMAGGDRGSQIQKSSEAVKRLDRLAPNLVHVCGFIWEWT